MSSKKVSATPEAQAEQLLRRGQRVRAQDLVSLIHEVNPTGRELPTAAEKRRYALKSKLQSLLVRRFPDELVVEPLDDSGVVGLRYRPQDRDACHAVIAELDEDARSWVRRALDLRESGPTETRSVPRAGDAKTAQKTEPSNGVSDSETLLRVGREALEAYDFERARACFERAFEDSDGATTSAIAFLELLVNHLAAYDDALECHDRLSPESAENATVRSLVAVAAAHQGDTEKCIRLLNGIEGRPAADAWAVAAKTSLAAGDLSRAETCVEQAKRLAPSNVELVSLLDELRNSRATARRPAEAELEHVAAMGDDVATEQRVRQLLAQWPDSTSGRRLLRELEERQREARANVLTLQGQRAFEAKHFNRAAQIWGEARVWGALGLDPRIREAVAADEALHRAERIANVVLRLAGGVSSTALAEYQSLASDEREQVFAEARLPMLEWLEELGRSGDERDRSTQVAAVLALMEAGGLNGPETDAQIVTLLEPYEATLRRLPPGAALLGRARASAAERRLNESRRTLNDAREAFAAGRHETALRLAEHVRISGPTELKAEADQFAREARKPLELRQRRDSYEALLRANRLLDALHLLDEFDLDGEADEATYWSQSRRELAHRLRRELKLEVHACGTPVAAPECSSIGSFRDDAAVYGLDGSAETFCWVTTHNEDLFIRVFAVADSRTLTLVALRPPVRMEFPRVQVEGGSLRVSASSGAVLELSTTDWSILRWRSSAGLNTAEEIVEQELLVPGTPFLWLCVRARAGGEEVTRVFDLGRGRIQRELAGGINLSLVPSPSGPRVFAGGFRRDGRLYTPSGNATLSVPVSVAELACVPNQPAYFGYARTGDEAAEVLELVVIDEHGRQPKAIALPDSWADSPHALATSDSARLTVGLYQGDGSTLAAFEVRDGSPSEVWRVAAPHGACLAQDVLGKHVAVSYPTLLGQALEPLGRVPPKFPLVQAEQDQAIPRISGHEFCGELPSHDAVEQEARVIKDRPSDVARARQLDEVLESRGDDPSALVRLASRLRSWRVEVEASRAALIARTKFPDHHLVRLDEAEEAARKNDWARVLDRLVDVDAQFEDDNRAHVHHLRGLALYHLNRFEEARIAFERCAAVPDGHCRVVGWADWLRCLSSSFEGPVRDEDSSAVRLFAAIRMADRFLAEDDGVRAQQQLDTTLGWLALEVQIAGRLAEAMLLQPNVSGEQHFRKRLMLAAFVESLDERRSYRGSLPLGQATWSEEKLAAIGLRARNWLTTAGL